MACPTSQKQPQPDQHAEGHGQGARRRSETPDQESNPINEAHSPAARGEAGRNLQHEVGPKESRTGLPERVSLQPNSSDISGSAKDKSTRCT